MAVMLDDSKLYATRAYEGRVLVIDPNTKTIMKRLDIGIGWFRSDDIDLDPSAQRLYIAVMDGAKRGVAIVNTRSDDIVDFIELFNAVPQALAISPSGKRVFVTTQDRWQDSHSQNALIDADTKRVLQLFDRPRTGGR
ncbi:MAG: YncE family protein [Gemmatimonadota bacterium]